MDNRTNRKVYISYAYSDKDKIDFIRNSLLENGFDLIAESDIVAGESWYDILMHHLNSSDFILICLTRKMFRDGVFAFEFEKEFFEQAKRRNILIIPILLEDLEIPLQFREFKVLDFRQHSNKQLDDLVKTMSLIDTISFDNLNGKVFEDLAYDLLVEYKFVNIKRESKFGDKGIDFIAEYFQEDPFNRNQKQIWIVETKFYKQERFDIVTIRKIIENYKYIGRNDAKLLLVTNAQLTSVVKQYLIDLQQEQMIDVVILDGFELRKFIANNDFLTKKYFSDVQPSQ